ncbi:DUF1015 domain-containing protein [Candidatus Omnitrophota bacterium]
MADVRPFAGVRYNQSLVGDLSAVICPPYDIIPPQLQQELYLKSEYNFIRIEHGRILPQDGVTDNKYTRSAATLEQWLRQGILRVDDAPAIYLHDHYYTHQGKEYKRRGIMACVRLQEWDEMVVRPHEGTLAEPSEDRLSLLWACQVNASPILALYEDPGQRVSSLLAAQERSKPLINLCGVNGEKHNILAITEPEVVNQICSGLAQQPLYIADGHHRYESSLTYQRERRVCSPSVTGNETFNFVMMTLVDLADPGLTILAPHRMVRGISKATLDEFAAKLRLLFDVEELPLDMPGVWQRVDDLLTCTETEETSQVRLVLFGLAAERLFMLRLRDSTVASQLMPYFHCELYKRLDVSIVDHIILEKLLRLSNDKSDVLAYNYDRQGAIDKVLSQEYQLAFLLSPIKAEVIKAIADMGDRLPRKSTYFYPKPPSGLVFNRLA